MRCLTLAEELRKKGHHCYFFCRLHKGNLTDFITSKGFPVFRLKLSPANQNIGNSPPHARWLGTSQIQDVRETIQIMKSNQLQFDWIIIDHYAIDHIWENEMRNYIQKIMVIDDLADREHNCDILLDQNYYENKDQRYINLVSPSCTLLLGPKYAPLRDEFLNLFNLPKTKKENKSILIMYGGSDPTNETLKAIKAINLIQSSNIKVHVVVGPSNPHKELIKKLCEENNYVYHYSIDYMARLMHEADFAICAGGSITWERYCLGTPAILTAIADNQVELCENLKKLGFDRYLGIAEDVTEEKIKAAILFFLKEQNLNDLSIAAKKTVDGKGKNRVIDQLLKLK